MPISQNDSHFLKRCFVERAGYVETFRLLIFSQSGATVDIKLAGLLAGVEPALLENGLGLLDLIGVGAKNRLSICLCFRFFGCRFEVRIGACFLTRRYRY